MPKQENKTFTFKLSYRYEIKWKNIIKEVETTGSVVSISAKAQAVVIKDDKLNSPIIIPYRCIISSKQI